MVVSKPAILIYTYEPDADFLREICAGIEEEGLLYEITGKQTDNVDELAHQAAEDSMLGSGIGISHQTVAMQMARLAQGKNVFRYYMPTYPQCRMLGENSARAVKKVMFQEEVVESG